jgi:tRNA nucleotidyltransferase (CCA-adding enzyme)
MLKAQLSKQAINPQALEVCRILNKAGYQAYIVGGCVRDLLLGVKPKDWDITTDASPKKVMEIFSKTIPTGLQHGTVTVVMGPSVENHFEVTTFRIEGEYKDGRRPEEVFFVMDVNKDLARRDLTINAIAYDPIDDLIVDPYHGIMDLENGILQAVGNPSARFKEDGLRIMRVARFAARFGYTVSPSTLEAMSENLDTLKKVSKERISDELSKTLMGPHSQLGMQLLQDSGALQIVSSILTQNSIVGLAQCHGELETKLAFLYSDFVASAVEQELMALKFSNKEIKRVIFLLQLLERFNKFVNTDTANTYKSFMALIKNHAPDACDYTLNQFIELTEALQYESRALFAKYQNETVFSKKEMKINGDDLMGAGIKPGPQIKNLLELCYLEILKNPDHNEKEFLLSFVK